MKEDLKILLTGVTGFLGSHTAIQLLESGYKVVGTVRDVSRIKAIRNVISEHSSKAHNLEVVVADLENK